MLAGIVSKHLGAAAGAARQSSFHSRRQLSYLAGRRQIAALTPRRGGYDSNPFRPSSPSQAIRSVRFSSSPTPPPADAVSSTPSAVPDINSLNDPNLIDLAAIPERMGYLKSLGLDYGWGISAITEHVVEALHIQAGLPWWGAAVGIAVLIRAIVFMPTITSADQSARMHHARELTTPIQSRMRECVQNSDTAGMTAAKQQLLVVHDRYGIKPALSVLPLIPAVLQFGGFRVLNGMGNLPVPALGLESVGWLPDVASPDPFYILPTSMAALLYFTLKRNMKYSLNSPVMPEFQTVMLYLFPALSFVFTCGFPSILQIYFMTSSVLHFGQTYLMTLPAFREFCNITPPPKEAVKKTEQPTVDVAKTGSETNISFIDRAMEGVKKSIKQFKTGFQKKIAAQREEPSTSHPRFTKKSELEQAQTYDNRRKIEEDHKRQMRNEQRKKKHKDNMNE